jgi:hypothetical protein
MEVRVRAGTPVREEVRLDHMVAYCFRDVLTGEVSFLDVNGAQTTGGARLIPVDEDAPDEALDSDAGSNAPAQPAVQSGLPNN